MCDPQDNPWMREVHNPWTDAGLHVVASTYGPVGMTRQETSAFTPVSTSDAAVIFGARRERSQSSQPPRDPRKVSIPAVAPNQTQCFNYVWGGEGVRDRQGVWDHHRIGCEYLPPHIREEVIWLPIYSEADKETWRLATQDRLTNVMTIHELMDWNRWKEWIRHEVQPGSLEHGMVIDQKLVSIVHLFEDRLFAMSQPATTQADEDTVRAE